MKFDSTPSRGKTFFSSRDLSVSGTQTAPYSMDTRVILAIGEESGRGMNLYRAYGEESVILRGRVP